MDRKEINISVTAKFFIIIFVFSFLFFMFLESLNHPAKAYESKNLSSPITITGDQNETPTTEDNGNEASDLNNFEIKYDSDGNISTNLDGGNSESTWNKIFKKYKGVIAGISGLCMLTFIVFFLLNITKVAANASNPVGRKDAIVGCVWTGIAAAASGSVLIITALFWNALK